MRTATAAAAAALLLLLGMTGALAQLSPEVVSAAIAKRYGVERAQGDAGQDRRTQRLSPSS